MLVAKEDTDKVNANLKLPPPIAQLFDDLCAGLDMNKKQKWIVVSAALLMFAESDPDVRGRYRDAVLVRAHPGGDFAKLADSARKGEIRKTADPDTYAMGNWLRLQPDIVKGVVTGKVEPTPDLAREVLAQIMTPKKKK